VRQVQGIDIEVARTDGAVWGRKAPGAGWDRLGTIEKHGAHWHAQTRNLAAWRFRGDSLMFEDVQQHRQETFDRQRDAVEFIVAEALAAARTRDRG